MFMRGLHFAVLVCTLAFGGAALANEVCDNLDGKVCLRAAQTSEGVTIFARNGYGHMPITLSLSMDTTNMVRQFGDDAPVTIVPGKDTRIAAFRAKGQGNWRYEYRFEWSPGDVTARHDDRARYLLPFAEGASFRVMQGCNGRFSHIGIQKYAVDFQMVEGTPIHAARSGIVGRVKEDSNRGGPNRQFINDGNFINILHSDGTHANYTHLRKDGAVVSEGQRVRAGDLIGYSGNTGFSTGPHLHFEVAKGAKGILSDTIPVTFDTARGDISCPSRGSAPIAAE